MLSFRTRPAIARGLDQRVCFRTGDAERLPFPDASFDAVICECAFCTFSDKTAAAQEFARVPEELNGLLAWVACIADAQPVNTYVRYLCDAGRVERVEPHDETLLEMVNQVRMKLLGAETMVGLKKLELLRESILSLPRRWPFSSVYGSERRFRIPDYPYRQTSIDHLRHSWPIYGWSNPASIFGSAGTAEYQPRNGRGHYAGYRLSRIARSFWGSRRIRNASPCVISSSGTTKVGRKYAAPNCPAMSPA
jgi:Methyltransferase domain